MKINIENCANQIGSDDGADDMRMHSVKEMIGNLKELRDRTAAGDMTALDEFFNLYVFNDDESDYERKPSGPADPEKEAAVAAVAMLREHLEKILAASNSFVLCDLTGQISKLLEVTEPQECLKMWEDTQERLTSAEKKVKQYMKANAENTRRATRLSNDVRSLLYVLSKKYKLHPVSEELFDPGLHEHGARVRTLLAGGIPNHEEGLGKSGG